jgi:hypothetical protein
LVRTAMQSGYSLNCNNVGLPKGVARGQCSRG